MDPGNHSNQCESFIAFSIEKPQHQPQYKCGSYPVYGMQGAPQLLSLFPFTPVLHPSKKRDSVKSFSWHEGQQMSEKDSGKDVVKRRESNLRSQKVQVGRARSASKCVPEATTVQNPCKKPRKKASLLSSKIRKANGLGSASSSRASVETVTPLTQTLTRSQHTTSVQILGGQAELENRPPNQGRRHGPRPKSSRFRGVTHYKRTGRWEAHIWKRGRQLYLGASSTADQAARAYDRAAIHFRDKSAALNFYLKDYAEELRQLMQLSDTQLVKMLRKQSAGDGTPYPEYPPVPELRNTPSAIRVRTREEETRERPSSSAAKTTPHVARVDPSNFKGFSSCSSSIGTMVGQSHKPQGVPTLHAPKARHVSERRGEYLQLLHNMIADIQNPNE